MSKRKSNRNLNDDEENSSKRHVGTTTENPQHFQEETVEMSQSPVFHIHIHVPAESTQNASKMYLPRIQPIIHLHYDELAKQLGKKKVVEKKRMSETYLREMVSQGMPKFGNILFHYSKDNSLRNDFNDEERISSTPKRVNRSRKISVSDLKRVGKKNISKVSNSEIIDKPSNDSLNKSSDDCSTGSYDDDVNRSCSDRSNGDTDESPRTELSGRVYCNNRPVRLKEAVVVLEDICKLKQYSGLSMGSVKAEETNTVGSSVPKKVNNSEAEVKVECECSFSRSDSPELKENFSSANNSSGTNSGNGNGESITALLEGCNFSEILKKFRRKNSQYITESLKNSKYLAQKKTVVKTEREESTEKEIDKGKENEKENGENNPETELNIRVDNSESEDKVDKTEEEENERKINFAVTQLESKEIVGKLSVNKLESECEYYLGDSDGEIKVFGEENTIPKDVTHSVVTSNSENNETETIDNLRCEINGEYCAIEFERSNKLENIVIKSEFECVEINEESNSIYNENENFDFETIKEENTMKKQSTDGKEKGKKTLRNDSNNSSSAKKMKSKEKSEKSIKYEKNEDYIPLNSSGPTKFSVAPLTSVQPYKTHDAKTFKKDMLFGNRVNRFNDSNHLKIYKMKKQAAGRRCD